MARSTVDRDRRPVTRFPPAVDVFPTGGPPRLKCLRRRPIPSGVDRLMRSRAGSNAVLIAASAVLPAAAMHQLSGSEPAGVTATQHLFVMAISSTVAALASALLMRGGYVR